VLPCLGKVDTEATHPAVCIEAEGVDKAWEAADHDVNGGCRA
jgi:hypothetical protein